MNPFVQRMTDARRMALDGVGPIRMIRNEFQEDFESCDNGWSMGQALCASDLDLFFDVCEAKIIEVIPKRRPGKNRVKIESVGAFSLHIDGEKWNLY